jgi:hypothetical protein
MGMTNNSEIIAGLKKTIATETDPYIVDFAKKLLEAEEDLAAGKVRPAREFFKEFKKKHNIKTYKR